jgi:flagellar hook assembly protein FlgD
VGFSSSNITNDNVRRLVGSTLYVDDVSFQFATGLTIPINEYFRKNILYPNPANGIVTLDYYLGSGTTDVTVKVYDVSGKVIKKIELGNKETGEHQLTLNVKDISSGTYFYSFDAGEKEVVKKFTIAR